MAVPRPLAVVSVLCYHDPYASAVLLNNPLFLQLPASLAFDGKRVVTEAKESSGAT